MTTILITGANRGIGFEMTKQWAEQGALVIAACRKPHAAAGLNELMNYHDNVVPVQMDVTSEKSVAAAAAQVKTITDSLDILVNNAGMLIRNESIASFDPADMQQTFDTNVVGPMLVAKHFIDVLMAGENPRLLNISSQLGSLALMENGRHGIYSYNASKAALNMLTRMMAHDLKAQGVTVVSVHPGWVQTEMGGSNADETPVDSAAGIIRLANGLTQAETNRFFVFDGSQHAW